MMKKILLITVFLLPVAAFAQQFPVIGSVPPNSTQNIVSGGLSDEDPLIIQNTSKVPLKFCMAPQATATCVGTPNGVTVEEGASKEVTVADLGGVAAGAYLNVSNSSLLIGSYVVTSARIPSASACETAIVDPRAWVFNPNDLTENGARNTLFLCSSRFDKVAINADNTTSNAFNFYVNGNVGVSTNLTVKSGLILNRESSSNANFISFRNSINTGDKGKIWVSANDNRGLYLSSGSDNPDIFINSNGQVGIGTSNIQGTQTKLAVEGLIASREVRILLASAAFPDYVFAKDYRLMGFNELEAYIHNQGHLPGVMSAADVAANKGVDMGALGIQTLEKVEEATLYILQLKKENELMQEQINELKARLSNLQQAIEKN